METKGNISIHAQNIMPVIKRWLYSDKDIFLFMKSKRKRILPGVAAVALCLILPGFLNGLTTAHYSIGAQGLSAPVRIAFVSDLHSCAYGDGMADLIQAVDREAPDLLLLGGDIFDDELPDDNTLDFLQGVSGRWNTSPG